MDNDIQEFIFVTHYASCLLYTSVLWWRPCFCSPHSRSKAIWFGSSVRYTFGMQTAYTLSACLFGKYCCLTFLWMSLSFLHSLKKYECLMAALLTFFHCTKINRMSNFCKQNCHCCGKSQSHFSYSTDYYL